MQGEEGGGRKKEARVKASYRSLLNEVRLIIGKVLTTLEQGILPKRARAEAVFFLQILDQAFNLTWRRTQNGEIQKNSEKLFSVFEHESELINSGKFPLPIEFRQQVIVSQGKSGIITDFRVMDRRATDRYELSPLLTRLQAK